MYNNGRIQDDTVVCLPSDWIWLVGSISNNQLCLFAWHAGHNRFVNLNAPNNSSIRTLLCLEIGEYIFSYCFWSIITEIVYENNNILF